VDKRARLFLSLIFVVGIGVPFFLSAPSLIGPYVDDYINRSALDKTLTGCKPDELRFQFFYGKHGEEGGTFNFKTRQLSGGDSNSGSNWSWSGQSRGPVFSQPLGDGKVFSDEETQHIKSLLASLPPGPPSSSSSYRDQIHLAFFQNGQLQIYHYPKSGAPPKLVELCQALGVAAH